MSEKKKSFDLDQWNLNTVFSLGHEMKHKDIL